MHVTDRYDLNWGGGIRLPQKSKTWPVIWRMRVVYESSRHSSLFKCFVDRDPERFLLWPWVESGRMEGEGFSILKRHWKSTKIPCYHFGFLSFIIILSALSFYVQVSSMILLLQNILIAQDYKNWLDIWERWNFQITDLTDLGRHGLHSAKSFEKGHLIS